MATATTSPMSGPRLFDLGDRTPANLNQVARDHILRNSQATAKAEIQRLRRDFRHPAVPSSLPINTTHFIAAATEGAQQANQPTAQNLDSTNENPPVTIAETANRLALETAQIHDTKIAAFSQSFLEFWDSALNGAASKPTLSKPSYAAVATSGLAAAPASRPPFPAAQVNRQYQQEFPARHQEQPTPPAPPRVDLRVFIRLNEDSLSWDRESYAIRTYIAGRLGIELGRVPQASRTKTGWAVRTADLTTRDLLIQRQSDWIDELGAIKAEASQKWYTYIVDDCPRHLYDLQGQPVDQEAATLEEITSQTGLEPVSVRPTRSDSDQLPTKSLLVSFLEPTKRRWRLFGCSRLARPIIKAPLLSQCENCWDYHSKYGCNREAHCKRCGKTGHGHEECSAPEQCVNCLAPHAADFPICPARPKRIHGAIQRLTKPQRDLVRQNGASLFRQHNMEIVAPAEATPSSPYPPISSPSMRRKQATPRRRQDLRIFQANVGKSGPSHDCALALADAERFDLILLQEPWTDIKEGRCLTKTHPAYDVFSPVDYWDGPSTRPRVMTYLRRSPALLADQLRPSPSRDMLWLHVDDITFVNVYRQPGVHETLDLLVQWPIPSRCVVVGDFNARHYSWQAGDTTGRGNDIASWASQNDLSLLNPPNKPTNLHGNTIDLAFSNIPRAEATVEDHLATSSDHFTLTLTIPSTHHAPCLPGKIRVTSDNELKRFAKIVEIEASALPTQTSSTEGLDALAASLTSMLQSAASRAGHLTRKRARAAP
ncbi:Endonuclease/exonuclease/phosphatase [Metarhizium guizhouense ARSEF 977]|uniref:Endonuclease/exonuclease/phosphatase n=1 Tax=Metarhizium guizhouense (strain ARSEF 977) TaxID=1276136 RepID=A0A0B4GUN6_METGA|nr:Endonuclease/exonuclease/phosphatase [Metarhizium guizhouense ARSEF 977]